MIVWTPIGQIPYYQRQAGTKFLLWTADGNASIGYWKDEHKQWYSNGAFVDRPTHFAFIQAP